MTKVFVIDDHPLLRQGITQLINNEKDMVVCGEAGQPSRALTFIEQTQPDVIVLDLSLQGASGIDLLHTLKAHFPERKILILSMHDETVFVRRALAGGASGYVLKHEATENVLSAIREVLIGKVYLSAEISSRLRQQFFSDSMSIPAIQKSDCQYKELHAA
jgi:DNA-binding NarL/FixJ family response regulator